MIFLEYVGSRACEYYLDIGPCINKIVGAALQSQDRQSYY